MSRDILGQISGEDWIKKGGLDVPDDIFNALDSPFDWFDSLKPINFSRGNLPTLENILDSFPETEIGDIVKASSLEMLRTSYGINKCFNSKAHINLTGKGNQIATSLKLKTRDRQIYYAAVQANNFFLNMNLLNKQLSSSSYNGQMGEVSIYQKVKESEIKNKDWLQSLVEKIQDEAVKILEPLLEQLQEKKDYIPEQVISGIKFVREKVLEESAKFYIDVEQTLQQIKNDFAEGIKALKEKALDAFIADMRELRKKIFNPAIKDFRTFIRKANKLLSFIKNEKYKNDSVGDYTVSSSFSTAIVPVASPNVIDVINVVNAIASGILQTFILKGVAIPTQLAEALTKTVTSIVLKGLNASGSEAVRYIAGDVLRGAKDLLPAVFNNTGMFAGVWGFLTSCAPYIIAAAVIIIIAIKLSQKSDIGNWITLLAIGDNKNQEPDTVFARLFGDVQEKLKDLGKLKEDLLQETGKIYENVYAFSFDGDARKLCVDMSLAVPVPMKDEIATQLWTEFSTKFDFLIQQ
ncbi:hypothetical protein [Anabaena azotica]|uniref:Uncharacterized protein n=1 Tax=Anabaena azotica FACHB-119 TaxID=947527 RepID=A0ABR8CYW8_9NOST|nr:hypothetical protein [Anabaena azotica]MBD2499857.1 hypothetical protein [Anabaena azotica FACHB-119]